MYIKSNSGFLIYINSFFGDFTQKSSALKKVSLIS